MDAFIETRFLNEIIMQANRALYCKNLMNSFSQPNPNNEDFYREAEHFIQHASGISLFLWNPREKKPITSRCLYLKEKLKINGASVLDNNKLRNSLVHFDERLDDWDKNSKNHAFIDQNTGNVQKFISGIEPKDFFRNYNPKNYIYSFWGEEYNIQDITNEIEKIKSLCKQRLQELALKKYKHKQ